MIRWEDYGIEIAGTARNGEQALEMIELRRPEIVITDIKMPLKSGLEVAEECSKKYGRVPLFIILTSFEEFDFVRRALSVQAVDYLVKIELSAESLEAAVTKALSMLREIRLVEEGGPERDGQARGAARARDEFFRALYQRRAESAEAFGQDRDSLGLDLPGPAFTVVLGEVLGADGKAAGSFLSAVWMLREMLEKLYPCYVTPLDEGRFTILFCLEDDDPACLRAHCEAGLLKTIRPGIRDRRKAGLRKRFLFQ
jgi:two-component system response regulator YesN